MTRATEGPAVRPLVAASTAAVADARLPTVGALRGFELFWIIGAGALAQAPERRSPDCSTTTSL